MNIENAIRVLAGTLMLTSIILSNLLNPNWIYLGVFVGINLIQSAFTGFCPAATILKKLGFKSQSNNCCGEQG